VANKHYVYKKEVATAFPKFFELVTKNRTNENEEIYMVEKSFQLNDWVAVAYDTWYIGKIVSMNPTVVEFMEQHLNEKYDLFTVSLLYF